MKYWLMKTEPGAYSWDDFKKEDDQTTYWDGIRNYQARNFMKEMKVDDRVFFYHSQVVPPAIMGVAKVVREAYPDHTQFDQSSNYFDPKSSPENPRWHMVDISCEWEFKTPVTLPELRQTPGLENMVLLNNSRLSVQPVTEAEWNIIISLRKK